MATGKTIADYVFAAVISRMANVSGNLNLAFLSREESLSQVQGFIGNNISETIWDSIFQKLEEISAFEIIADEISGDFYKISPGAIVQLHNNEIGNPESLIYKYKAIGPEFLNKALSVLVDEDGEVRRDRLPLDVVGAPASDRIVSFGHNEISEFDERASEIIDIAEKLNQIDEIPGLREVIVGQLKAGRELVRAGSFKLYVMQNTLIEALMFLAKRYEKEAIGALASTLLTALLAQFGNAM